MADCEDLEDTFAAAQADYEARILSALEPSNKPGTFDLDQMSPDQRVNISRPESQRALEPSAARELALEEAARAAENAALEYNLSECAGLADWAAFEAGQESGLKHAAAAIRALSSPDHIADAGKVVGECWLPIESAPKDGTVIQAWHQVHKCPVSVLWKDGGFPYGGERLNWYERSYTTAWPERAFTHWRPLPSAPSQEVAGS